MAKTQSVQTLNRLVMVSVTYFVLAFFVLSAVIYAWFTITNTNSASLVAGISGVEAEYQFYIYEDSTKSGSNHMTLMNNVCTTSITDQCYHLVSNPTIPTLINGYVAPGERFSFAIRIVSVGSSSGRLKLDLGGLISTGFDLPVNKIQSAFGYEVTKISYIEMGVESEDMKDLIDATYYNQHFTHSNNGPYQLIEDVPMGSENGINSIVIIFFDIFFDPTVFGFDSEGNPYENSNIFMNQIFTVQHIFMTVYP